MRWAAGTAYPSRPWCRCSYLQDTQKRECFVGHLDVRFPATTNRFRVRTHGPRQSQHWCMSTAKDVMRPRRRSWRSVQALELERRSQPTSEPLTVAYASTDWAPELKWWMSTVQPSSCRSRDLKEHRRLPVRYPGARLKTRLFLEWCRRVSVTCSGTAALWGILAVCWLRRRAAGWIHYPRPRLNSASPDRRSASSRGRRCESTSTPTCGDTVRVSDSAAPLLRVGQAHLNLTWWSWSCPPSSGCPTL